MFTFDILILSNLSNLVQTLDEIDSTFANFISFPVVRLDLIDVIDTDGGRDLFESRTSVLISDESDGFRTFRSIFQVYSLSCQCTSSSKGGLYMYD